MPSLLPLLRPGYWFSIQAIPFLPWSSYFVLAIMLGLIVASVGLWHFSRNMKTEKDLRRSLRKGSYLCLWAGIVGFILYGLTWMGVPLLSMRFFFVVWFLGFAYWAWTIIRYTTRELPLLHKQAAERAAYEKWLPRHKK